jgi:excinuclease UvrABC ATPase subunit
MKIVVIDELIKIHGNILLSELRDKILSNTPYVCPKCNGLGYSIVQYNAYPSGFPDSGWAVDMQDKKVRCEVCHGEGYTKKLLKPVIETKVTGYA